MHKNWRWNLHGHISMLPFTLLYALVCRLLYKGHTWRFRNGVLTCIGPKLGVLIPGTGAQCIGACQVFADERNYDRDNLHVHENGHIVQQMACAFIGLAFAPVVLAALDASPAWGLALGGFLGTPIWGTAYGACFLVCWLKQGGGPWRTAYRANPFEAQCFAIQDDYIANTRDRPKAWK